jgi:hypothetical protein
VDQRGVGQHVGFHRIRGCGERVVGDDVRIIRPRRGDGRGVEDGVDVAAREDLVDGRLRFDQAVNAAVRADGADLPAVGLLRRVAGIDVGVDVAAGEDDGVALPVDVISAASRVDRRCRGSALGYTRRVLRRR